MKLRDYQTSAPSNSTSSKATSTRRVFCRNHVDIFDGGATVECQRDHMYHSNQESYRYVLPSIQVQRII